MTTQAETYYAEHRRQLREHGASNAARVWPEQALQYTTVDGGQHLPFPSRLPVRSASAAVRRAHKGSKQTVHEYDMTTREGTPLRIVYVRHAPGTWDNIDDVVDVYEIPGEHTENLDRALAVDNRRRHATSADAMVVSYR